MYNIVFDRCFVPFDKFLGQEKEIIFDDFFTSLLVIFATQSIWPVTKCPANSSPIFNDFSQDDKAFFKYGSSDRSYKGLIPTLVDQRIEARVAYDKAKSDFIDDIMRNRKPLHSLDLTDEKDINKLLDDIIIRRITPEEWFLENPEWIL